MNEMMLTFRKSGVNLIHMSRVTNYWNEWLRLFWPTMYNFYGATTMIKGAAHGRIILVAILGQSRPFGDKNKGLNIIFNFSNPQKSHPCPGLRLLSHSTNKSV